MSILIKDSTERAGDTVNRILSDIEGLKSNLECLQSDVVDKIKYIMTQLVSIEPLYELRDYIDDLIVNWEDEEIEIEEDDL